VNGVQCCFELSADAALVASPACTSDHDRPARRELVLEAGDRVVSVQCRSGALVDSLEVVTAAGKVLRVGGNGGGDICKVSAVHVVLFKRVGVVSSSFCSRPTTRTGRHPRRDGAVRVLRR
jgi:hypothetical protein